MAPELQDDPGVSPPDDPYLEEVRRKAERMSRARGQQRHFWTALIRAGAIGWQLALPLVAGAVGGHALSRAIGQKWPALTGLLLGLVFGIWQAGVAIQRATRDAEEG
ncbi:MAG: AtpZ/AtpI family protein [Myxococcales bacterium]|nr:AtpZ/AtpI family protein [Myxococcales bacterium]